MGGSQHLTNEPRINLWYPIPTPESPGLIQTVELEQIVWYQTWKREHPPNHVEKEEDSGNSSKPPKLYTPQ